MKTEIEFLAVNPDKFNTELTESFADLLDKALLVIKPYIKETAAPYTNYFEKEGFDLFEFDCCDNESCVKKAAKKIRQEIGKGKHLKNSWYHNEDGHDRIERCCICDKPLNEFLAHIGTEVDFLLENQLTKDFIIGEAFLINAVLTGAYSPHDSSAKISGYSRNKGGKYLAGEIEQREHFFQDVAKIAAAVIKELTE